MESGENIVDPHFIELALHFLKRNQQMHNELLRQSIKSEGVVNLFSDVKEEFSISDPKLLAEVVKLKQKNIAVELLENIND